MNNNKKINVNMFSVSFLCLSVFLVVLGGCTDEQMSQDVQVQVTGGHEADFTFTLDSQNFGDIERGDGEHFVTFDGSGSLFEIYNDGTAPAQITMYKNETLFDDAGSSWKYATLCKAFNGGEVSDVIDYPTGTAACDAGTIQAGFIEVTGTDQASATTVTDCLKYSDSTYKPGVVIEQSVDVSIQEPLGSKTSYMKFVISDVNDLAGLCGGSIGYEDLS